MTLYRSVCLQMFYKIFDVFKNFANFTEKHLCQVKCELKSLTLSMQPAPSLTKRLLHTVIFQCVLQNFQEYLSFRTLLGECFAIFKSNKCMKLSFLLTVFYRKSKTKQKS